MKKVSIIIPCYNNAKYIEKAIASLKKQTYRDIEVIVIDDSSDDETLETAQAAAGDDRRFLFTSLEHGGVAKARNYGIKAATGEYLMFLDADDAYLPFGIEKFVLAAEKTEADIVTGGFINVVKGKAVSSYTPSVCGSFSENEKEEILQKVCIGNDPALASFIDKLYRTEFLTRNSILFPEILSGEDVVFALEAHLLSAKTVVLSDNDFYLYEQNPDSFTKKKLSVDERLAFSDIFFEKSEEVLKKYGREDLIKFLNARRVLSVYDFVMTVVSRDDFKKNEKCNGLQLIADSSNYSKKIDKNALSYHSAKVKILVKTIICGHVKIAYSEASFINFIKKIAEKAHKRH